MVFSKKGLFIIGLGFLPLIFIGWITWLIYLAILLVIVSIDIIISAKKTGLEVNRSCSERFVLAGPNKVNIAINNKMKFPMRLMLKDDFPIEILGSREPYQINLLSGETKIVSYLLTPYKRGLFQFGAINLKILSRFGLFYFQIKYAQEGQQIKVYPNMLAGHQQFLKAEKGNLQNEHVRSLLIATGTDFRGIREYVVGDEFRKINWPATARRGRMMVNEFSEDRSQPVYIVLDNGRMMTEKAGYLSKLDHAINASAILAYIGLARGEQVGLTAFDKQIHTFSLATKGKAQFQVIMEQMYQMQPTMVESNYRNFWQFFQNRQRRRSLVCFFTDLVDAQASQELVANLSRLARQHLVLCIIFKDQELASKAEIMPESYQEVYEKGVANELKQAKKQALAQLKGAGVIVIDEAPNMIAVATINKYLELRAKMR